MASSVSMADIKAHISPLSETQAAIDDTTSLECLVLNFMN
jgi:hypothetical protein